MRLPRAQQLKLGVGEFERAWFLGTLPLLNDVGASEGRIDTVSIRFIGDDVERTALDRHGKHVYRSQWTVRQASPGLLVSETSFPLSVAMKLPRLVEATVAFHGWPELRFVTGGIPEEVSAARAAVFGSRGLVASSR